jgi:cytochrome b561
MLRNTRERWGSVSIGLHWTVAALVLLVQVPIGFAMLALEPGANQDLAFNIHKTNGVVIFLLAVFRLGWRWAYPVPELPSDLPAWQARAAGASHATLYVLLFAMPISGFLYTAMGGFPVPLFMLYDVGPLVPENEALAERFRSVHVTLQWACTPSFCCTSVPPCSITSSEGTGCCGACSRRGHRCRTGSRKRIPPRGALSRPA